MSNNPNDSSLGLAAEVPRLPEDNTITTEVTPSARADWLGYAIQACLALIVGMLILGAYHFAVIAPNKQKIAVVDIESVLSLKELEVTIAAMKPGNVEANGAAAFDQIAKFAKEIETALAEIQQECGCTLLVKAAVVKPLPSDDLTPQLKKRLGVDGLDQAKLVEQLRAIGGEGKPPILEGGVK